MRVVAVAGPEGVGKSSFCFSFSKFLQKRGISAEAANFDPACKRIKYKPAFDVRSHCKFSSFLRAAGGNSEKALEEVWLACAGDKKLLKHFHSVATNVVLVDLRTSLDSLAFGSARRFLRLLAPEKIFFLADATLLADSLAAACFSDAAALVEKATGAECIAIANKSDLLARRQQHKATLGSAFAPASQKIFYASALERSGFQQLLELLAPFSK